MAQKEQVNMHKKFIDTSMSKLQQDTRILGAAVGGSWLRQMDEFSDIDLIVAVQPEAFESVMRDRITIAESLGTLLAAFTGEHVGEPRMIICLYDVPPLLHVDLKFVSLPDIATRSDELEVLWEREGALSKVMASKPARYPVTDLQWIENRLWIWVHYAATKLGRGELFEVIDALTFVRAGVLGPMVALKHGQEPRGSRRLETIATDELPALIATHPAYDRADCGRAILATIELYRQLRDAIAPPTIVRRTEAEHAAVQYLQEIIERIML
jgi:hypothetical protein